jgi:hypothetical protein
MLGGLQGTHDRAEFQIGDIEREIMRLTRGYRELCSVI